MLFSLRFSLLLLPLSRFDQRDLVCERKPCHLRGVFLVFPVVSNFDGSLLVSEVTNESFEEDDEDLCEMEHVDFTFFQVDDSHSLSKTGFMTGRQPLMTPRSISSTMSRAMSENLACAFSNCFMRETTTSLVKVSPQILQTEKSLVSTLDRYQEDHSDADQRLT